MLIPSKTYGPSHIAALPAEVHRGRHQVVVKLPSEGNTKMLVNHLWPVMPVLTQHTQDTTY